MVRDVVAADGHATLASVVGAVWVGEDSSSASRLDRKRLPKPAGGWGGARSAGAEIQKSTRMQVVLRSQTRFSRSLRSEAPRLRCRCRLRRGGVSPDRMQSSRAVRVGMVCPVKDSVNRLFLLD